ncbi:MAG: hypothetical protein AB7P48_14155, partial [Methylocystis sp.]
RSDPRQGSSTGRLFRAVREWVALIIARGQALGVGRTDLPQSLLIDSTMALLESLDRWVVANWSRLERTEKDAMPQKHIALFRSLISAPSTGDAR